MTFILFPSHDGQDTDCDLDIYISEAKYYLNPSQTKNDTATIKINDSTFLFVHLYSCKGKLDFILKDTTGQLIVSGSYKESPTTFTRYAFTFGGEERVEEKVYIIKYYFPIQDGKWTFVKNGVKSFDYYNVQIIKDY